MKIVAVALWRIRALKGDRGEGVQCGGREEEGEDRIEGTWRRGRGGAVREGEYRESREESVCRWCCEGGCGSGSDRVSE